MGDISLHIDATYKWNYAMETLRSPNIHSALLMNTSPAQVQSALQHVDFLVVRVFDPFHEYGGGTNPDFEKKIIQTHQGYEFVQALDRMGYGIFKGNKKVRFVVGWNELYGKRGNDLRKYNDRMVAIGQALINAGYGVGMGAYATDKSFYPDDVENGHWDNVIRFAVVNSDMVSIECHEYDVGRPANGHLKDYPDGFPDSLSNPDAMQYSNFAPIPYRKSQGAIENNYKIGRIALLIERSYEITGASFYWYRGECLYDFKDDGPLKQWIEEWYRPKFGNPRGINTLFPYYQFLAGGTLDDQSFDGMLFNDLKWLADNDPPENQGNFIFSQTRGVVRDGVGEWDGFDPTRRPGLITTIRNYSFDTQSEPEPSPEIVFKPDNFTKLLVSTTTGGNVRVRNVAGLNSVILDVFFNPEPQEVLMVLPSESIEGYPIVKDGFIWVYVIFAGGIDGWTAYDLLHHDPVTLPDTTDYKAMVEAIREIVN